VGSQLGPAGQTFLVLTAAVDDIASVDAISGSLVDLYRALGIDGEVTIYPVEDLAPEPPLLRSHAAIFRAVALEPPDYLCVVHPLILRTHFFQVLLSLLAFQKTEIVIHVFGDFLRQALAWRSLEVLLVGRRTLLLAPSTCYVAFLRKFFRPGTAIRALPFPVTVDHPASPLIRGKDADQTLDFIYAGRILPQKNLTAVIDFLERLQIQTARRITLTIAGEFEYLDNHTVGGPTVLGEEFYRLASPLRGVEVRFVGHQDRSSLGRLYREADFYVSFTTYHDDEFCRSAIEALLHGLPIVVTRWGGHGDLLKLFPDRCIGISVTPTDDGFELELEDDRLEDLLKKKEQGRVPPAPVESYFSRQRLLGELRAYLGESTRAPFPGVAEDLDYPLKAEAIVPLTSDRYRHLYEEFWKQR
jgi:glycosyltransferase involved in cell wall biosynthesis